MRLSLLAAQCFHEIMPPLTTGRSKSVGHCAGESRQIGDLASAGKRDAGYDGYLKRRFQRESSRFLKVDKTGCSGRCSLPMCAATLRQAGRLPDNVMTCLSQQVGLSQRINQTPPCRQRGFEECAQRDLACCRTLRAARSNVARDPRQQRPRSSKIKCATECIQTAPGGSQRSRRRERRGLFGRDVSGVTPRRADAIDIGIGEQYLVTSGQQAQCAGVANDACTDDNNTRAWICGRRHRESIQGQAVQTAYRARFVTCIRQSGVAVQAVAPYY